MGPAAIVAWSLAGASLVLALLGLRAWFTLREGRGFQDRLRTVPTEELHRFLSAPRGAVPGHPADILYRLNALMEFERRGDPRLLPLYVALLEDPHPALASVSREALEEATGQKFRDGENETEADPAAWRRWWEETRPR